jgi:hypothetical protein
MRLITLTALCVLAGCSSNPPESQTAPVVAAATTSAPAAAAEPAATAATSEKKPFKPPPGYKVKIDDWDIVYCKKIPLLGSRFPKEVCMTEPQLKEHLAAMETMKRDKEQISHVCSQAAGCANP